MYRIAALIITTAWSRQEKHSYSCFCAHGVSDLSFAGGKRLLSDLLEMREEVVE